MHAIELEASALVERQRMLREKEPFGNLGIRNHQMHRHAIKQLGAAKLPVVDLLGHEVSPGVESCLRVTS